MGNIVGSAMEAQFKRQQDFMTDMNRGMMERQIQMQNQMRERMAAMQLARSREMFMWFSSFYVLACIGMVTGFRKTGKPGIMAPMLPLTFIVGYQGDMAYGTKMNRIISEAENILAFERDVIEIPGGVPTLASLDLGRMKVADDAKLHAVTPHDQK